MEAKELKLLAAGRWESIVASLAPQLVQAVERAPHHVPCPVHGGTDGFRLFRDFDETGGGVCNTCGIHHDGYTLLMWANGWDFLTTHHAIHDMLLGSGELGKEVIIALQRLGVETIAVDRYDHAPGQQVAHHARTVVMSDPALLSHRLSITKRESWSTRIPPLSRWCAMQTVVLRPCIAHTSHTMARKPKSRPPRK